MNWHHQIDHLNQIPDNNFSGYLWASDKSTPEIISKIDSSIFENNEKPAHPFIREAYLYDSVNNISISVKHVSGKYLIHQFNLNELSEDDKKNIVPKSFLAHNSLGEKLHFKEIWCPEKDDLCNNFEVLRKKAVVFSGFGKDGK